MFMNQVKEAIKLKSRFLKKIAWRVKRTLSRFNVEIEGLKKMYVDEKLKCTQLKVEVDFLNNLVATGNICGKLEKINPGDKYKVVLPCFSDNCSLKVDKGKREAFLSQFKTIFNDNKGFIENYEDVVLDGEGEFVMTETESTDLKSVNYLFKKDCETSDSIKSIKICCSCRSSKKCNERSEKEGFIKDQKRITPNQFKDEGQTTQIITQ